MINVQKQIEYWKATAESDFETAELLIKNKKILHGLFFCHLTIEKILKAHVAKTINDIPPKSHNLKYLLDITKINLEQEEIIFLTVLMKYLLEGRYPDNFPNPPAYDKSIEYLHKTKELFICLKQKL
jgi:HEPN domain-containing protein